MFLGTSRFRIRQPLKKLRQQAGQACSISKNDRGSKVFLELSSHKCSYGQVEWMHFDKPAEKFSEEGQNNHAHCSKMKRDIKIDEKIFPRSVPMVTLNAFLLFPLAQVPWKDKVITFDVRWWSNSHFFLSSLNGDCSYGLWECSFLTNPTKISCMKGGEFSLKVVIWLKKCNFFRTANFPVTWSSA